MRKQFELVKKNLQRACIDYSVKYFNDKSAELCNLFTIETTKLLN